MTIFLSFFIQNVVAAAAAQNASDIIQNQVVQTETIGNYVNHYNVQPTTKAASAAAANLSPEQQCFLNDIQ